MAKITPLKAGVAAVAAAAAVSTAYYLVTEYFKTSATANAEDSKVNYKDKENIVSLLKSIQQIQKKTKNMISQLTEQLINKPLTLMEIYDQIKDTMPDDPLKSCGISIDEFDNLLNEYEHDEEVKVLVSGIMGQEETGRKKKNEIKVEDVVVIHEFMLNQLEQVVKTIKELGTVKNTCDSRVMTMAAQALVGAKVKEQFKVNPEDVEDAVMSSYVVLQYDQKFNSISVKMQAVMSELVNELGA